MLPGAGPPGAEDLRPEVRLAVDSLEHVRSLHGVLVLHATGRAWAMSHVALGAPVLLAGTARVAAEPGTPGVAAGPHGPRWSADFPVPAGLAGAAAWAIELAPAAASDPRGPEDAEHLAEARRAVAHLAERLEGRLTEIAALASRVREAEGRRERAATGADGDADARVAALETALATLRDEHATLGTDHDALRIERDDLGAERDRALLELDETRAVRDTARREVVEAARELERVEVRWTAAAEEVRELRAKLKVSSTDRTGLVGRLAAVTAERDGLRRPDAARPVTTPPAPEPAPPAQPPHPRAYRFWGTGPPRADD